MNVSVKKTDAIVCALRKLHNFCIDTESNMDVPMPTPANEWLLRPKQSPRDNNGIACQRRWA